ncbi:hypothetical protein [Halorubellus sp. PRR65]|uniref:hypothetical protein n=1 Tax=Halorubellus sp. PRR65 TaxID=3098148 RepID=UPI002B260093|nr:hypothetical protein [Halorubellus sp. PRR65]
MAQSQQPHDPTDRRPRGTAKYCAYCGTKLFEDPPTDRETDVGRLLERPFCDDACEGAWNIDATSTHTGP